MYQALESASKQTSKEVILVECGWFANDFIQKAFIEAAQLACPSIRVIRLDGRNQEERSTAWASADVFCSLSDNIQETFGITPIEAMAAGIPVVVSDWDGYKDTVRDGIDGFRIPTIMPQAEFGTDLALRHALEIDTYDLYCGYTSSLIAVDVEAAKNSFVRLFESKDLRQRMGSSGQERARAIYDWKEIIRQYETLWGNLKDIRLAKPNVVNELRHPWPARMDPFYAFASYPTETLMADTVLRLNEESYKSNVVSQLIYQNLAMVKFAKMLFPTEVELKSILQKVENKHSGEKAIELVSEIPETRKPYVYRSLAWLVKIGVLSVVKL
jgi:hypothetical protein